MNRKLKMLAVLFLVSMAAWGQEFKIGYTNIDAIVFSMPEMTQINSDLEVYQKQLANQVNAKRSEIQTKIQDYQQLGQGTAEIVVKEKEKEINDLQTGLQTFVQQAEQASQRKQAELLNPVYTKVQEAIEAVRQEKGYAMILNAQVGSGGAVVLAGREEDNITEAVFNKLGVPVPKPAESTTDTPSANSGDN